MKGNLHPRDIKVAGILAWTPLVCLIVYLILCFTIYRDGLPAERYYDQFGDYQRVNEDLFLLLVGAFCLKWFFFLFSLITMKFYTLGHLSRHHDPGRGEKSFWIISIVLLGTFFIPIYNLSVLKKTPKLYEENPPLFNFDPQEP